MIDESGLSKGDMRKLTALRKSLGADIADKAFAEWQKTQKSSPEAKPDPLAAEILAAVSSVVEGKNLGRYGYTVRKSRAGLTVTRNTALAE